MARKPVPRSAPPPWLPAPYDEADTAALKAVAAGKAGEGQQQRAIHWIIYTLCQTYDQPYRPGPDGERETVFACAKQFVGQQIIKQLKLTS